MIVPPASRSKHTVPECASPSPTSCACGKGDHVVQFYERDESLVQYVGEFMAKALRQEARSLILATSEHIDMIDAWLRAAGIATDDAIGAGRYVRLDAAETLQRFSVAGVPDEALFRQVVGGIVAELTASGDELFAFGEMVAVLWQRGEPDEALRVEEFWNRLAGDCRFNLLCGYPMKGFGAHSTARFFEAVCRSHRRVLPTEAFQPCDGLTDDQLRQIAILQQRAAALEGEMAERAQNESAFRHLAAIVESSDDAIVSKNLDGIITSWNPGAERIFGYRREEAVGRSITILIPAERLHEEDMILGRLRRGERIDHYETVRRRKDGRLLNISLTISPMRDGSGRVVGASKIARDVTEQKSNAAALEKARAQLQAARDELERTNHQLEERVRERTASLTDLLSQMETFSYTVSHDLRAPLRAIAGYAAILQSDYATQLDADARRYVDRIVSACDRMNRLIRDVLAYARVNRDRLDLKPISLAESVAQVVQHSTELQPPHATIVIQSDAPAVLGNPAFLTQIFANLLGNAVKFVAPGQTPEVTVSFEREGDLVRTVVRDNGIGIKPELHRRLFGLFERVHEGGQYEGTGIGLAIVKRAVERMGGAVGVISDGAHGCRFWFTLRHAGLEPILRETVPIEVSSAGRTAAIAASV